MKMTNSPVFDLYSETKNWVDDSKFGLGQSIIAQQEFPVASEVSP